MLLGKFGKKDTNQNQATATKPPAQSGSATAITDPPPPESIYEAPDSTAPLLSSIPPEPEIKIRAFPGAPSSLGETGLPSELLVQLLVKTLFTAGELTEASGGALLKLPYSVMKELLTLLGREKLVEVCGHGEPLGVLYRYGLTDAGRQRAQAYMEVNRYVGPAPVPIGQYETMVRNQPVSDLRIDRQTVEQATKHLVLSAESVEQVGEAVNSGWSIFLYGPPGNGETVIAEAIGHMLGMVGGGEIFVPYAIEVDSQIIQVFDPLTHKPIDPQDASPRSLIEAKVEHDTR